MYPEFTQKLKIYKKRKRVYLMTFFVRPIIRPPANLYKNDGGGGGGEGGSKIRVSRNGKKVSIKNRKICANKQKICISRSKNCSSKSKLCVSTERNKVLNKSTC